MTINQKIENLNSVLSGKEVIINANNPKAMCAISTDGINWLVNGIPVSTIESRKRELEFIKLKGELAIELAQYIGLDPSSIFEQYQLCYDSLDGMMLLTDNELLKIVFIYITSSNFVIKQIDKISAEMLIDSFWIENGELNHSFVTGVLSSKSMQILSDEKRSMTQNFYYDMLFDGINSYEEMSRLGEKCKIQNFSGIMLLKKIKYMPRN